MYLLLAVFKSWFQGCSKESLFIIFRLKEKNVEHGKISVSVARLQIRWDLKISQR